MKILSEINKTIGSSQLIYFCREAERALGLEKLIDNYHICCIEDSNLVQSLINSGVSVFCLEREGVKLSHKSSGKLISHKKTQKWIRKVTNSKRFFAQTLIPTNALMYKINLLGGELIGNPYKLNKKFENKMSVEKILKGSKVRVPKSKVEYFHNLNYDEIIKSFGNDFVLQKDRAHTGLGTYISPDKLTFNNLVKSNKGNIVKVSEFIKGKPLTVNVCIYNSTIFIGGLQYQITGTKELVSNPGTTIGNDFGWFYSNGISDELLVDLTTEISRISNLLIKDNYKGLFGLDFIVKDKNVFLIEINARQTSNLAFQTKLELKNKVIPLSAIHLAEFLEIKIDLDYEHMPNLKGSQVFLRANNPVTIRDHNFKSGAYKLQSDNSSKDWEKEEPKVKDNVIFIDEEQDKPLIFQKNEYNITNIDLDSFLMHFPKSNNQKRMYDELCRMQFNSSIVDKTENIQPWIIEALSTIKKEIV